MDIDYTNADYINGIAAVIRRYHNQVDTKELAKAISTYLNDDGTECSGCTKVIADVIDRVNPDRTMGAGALAEAIWNDLNADED